jgi:hypothetical protein
MPPKAPMDSTTATMQPAQRAESGFCLGATLRPARRPAGAARQGGEQTANHRLHYTRPVSKFLSSKSKKPRGSRLMRGGRRPGGSSAAERRD